MITIDVSAGVRCGATHQNLSEELATENVLTNAPKKLAKIAEQHIVIVYALNVLLPVHLTE